MGGRHVRRRLAEMLTVLYALDEALMAPLSTEHEGSHQ
jgi:hypothetical protein